MPTVDVTPASLRDAGEALVVTRNDDLDGSRNIDRLHGHEDDQFFSTGGFPAGVRCQERLTALFGQACQAYARIYQDMFGLASALYVVADVLGSIDKASALEFAFAAPGAKIPPGLPDWIDPKQTGRELAREMQLQHQLAAALNGDGVLPAGWSEKTFRADPSSGVMVTEIRDPKGRLVIRRQTTTGYDGSRHVVVHGYDDNGNRIRQQVTNTYADGSESTNTEQYDEDGNLVGLQEYRKDANGGWTSTTYDPDKPNRVTAETTHSVDDDGGWRTVEYERDGSGELVGTSERARTVHDDGSIEYDSYGYEDGRRDPEQHVDEWEVNAQPPAIDYQESQEHFYDQLVPAEPTFEEAQLNSKYQHEFGPEADGGVPWEVVEHAPSGVPVFFGKPLGDGTYEERLLIFNEQDIEHMRETEDVPERP